MKQIKKKKPLQRRRGTTMVELLGVMVVIAILAAIAIGGIGAARDNANETSAQSDIKTYTTAIQQVVMIHPEVMKFTALSTPDANGNMTKPANAIETLVGYINDQMEEQWKFEVLPNPDGSNKGLLSGGVATSTIKRDAWGNPYGLYIYMDEKAPTYIGKDDQALKEADSCVYIAIVSAGKNATGGPVGHDGNNFEADTRKIASASAMVNNTDGADDIGVIIRVLNGDIYTATFGLDKTTLGSLKGIQWIFGVPSSTGGICFDYTTESNKTATAGGSIDKYYDSLQIKTNGGKLFGSWT